MISQALILDARVQLRALLDEHPGAVDVLRERLMDGNVSGYTYWSYVRECGCVLGTVAFAEGVLAPREVATRMAWSGPARDRRPFRALEDWAVPIRRGDVSDHKQPVDSGPFRAALLVSWIDEWKAERA